MRVRWPRPARLGVTLSLLASLTLAAAAQAPDPQAADAPQTETAPVYVLTAGDVVELKFTHESSLNDTVTIRPDGRISLAIIGELVAEGLRPEQLSEAVQVAYERAALRRPQVTAIVREFAGLRAYVGGEVQSPSVVSLRGHVTAVQAILASGGFTRNARLDSVVLLRYRDRETAEVRKLDVRKVMDRTIPDVTLRPYDVVYVPMSRIAKVNAFVEQYVHSMVPRALVFPYNLNQTVVVQR